MFLLLVIPPVIILLLGIRTSLWHLGNWQIREYRWDRMKAYLRTKEGTKNLFNLWFFRGILPRPKFTGRIFIILFIFGFFTLLELYFLFLGLDFFCEGNSSIFCRSLLVLFYFWLFLFWERTIFVLLFFSVIISKIPVYFRTKKLFNRARLIIQNRDPQIKIVAITGSYGKSSTKEILVHLLQGYFGEASVLFNPENQNNEVSIARLILKNKSFFHAKKEASGKRFFVCEIGAYKKGEIKKVCDFIFPQIGIITGINQQHIELFGSQKNITEGKFELAESASEKVFFRSSDPLLHQIFCDKKISAKKIALDPNSIKHIQSYSDRTEFELYGEKFNLPWPGEFFVQNAFLGIECVRELGIKREEIPQILCTIPPLERALKIKKLDQLTVLQDLYSSNSDGVLSAINHLQKFSGQKIFVGKPLLELGTNSEKIHREIFEKLSAVGAIVFWEKDDFFNLGKEILDQNFYPIKTQKERAFLQKMLKTLGSKDVVLLESKLLAKTLKLFSKAR